jgi:hypothetical protein
LRKLRLDIAPDRTARAIVGEFQQHLAGEPAVFAPMNR